ncbi:MAG: bifunctional UDP-N-acetylmuramoyl-tripeptide:D-alanyl-D-alanine ligase/alanine racemase, partial [Sphingobacteriales bacterium]
MEEKIREKLNFFVHAQLLIYNSDSFLLHEQVKGYLLKKNSSIKFFTWGKHGEPDLRIEKIARVANATSVTCNTKDTSFDFQIPFTDNASVENAITCCAVLLCLEIPLEEIKEKFHHLRAVEMRLELKQGINHCSVINDSYSSDMHSLVIALDYLAQQKQHTKRTLILSDLLQQEQDPGVLYSKVSALLQSKQVERFIGIGPEISHHHDSFKDIPQKEFYPDTATFLNQFSSDSFNNETIL